MFSRPVHPVEVLLHTLRVTTCCLTHHGLHPSCLHSTEPHHRATLLHKLETMGSRAMTTSPSARCRNGRGSSPSELESSSTLVFVELLERIRMDIKFSTIFHVIGWEKLYEVPRSGSHLLTLEFFTSFDSFTRGRKSYVHFCLFGRDFEFEFSRFSELMDLAC
jgi:hypothetical protein